MFGFFRINRPRALASLLLTSALYLPAGLSAVEPTMPMANVLPAADAAPGKLPALTEKAADKAPTAEKVAAPAPAEPVEACAPGTLKFPPVTGLPRAGLQLIPPAGPGYYSLWDEIRGDFSEKPPKYPYPRTSIIQQPFFNIDWSYLDDPCNTETDCFDFLKRIPIGCNMKFTTGGEFRFRYANEVDSRLSGVNNIYQLYRTRVYGDLTIGDRVRLYAEYLDAQSFHQDLAPLPIDRDRSDILNAFVELRTIDIAGDPLYVRTGRQELCYGSQRLISALDWANTRRTFDGIKAYWHSEKLDVDAFCVQPVVVDPARLDSKDNNRIFAGLWTTYRPRQDHTADLYYLFQDNTNAGPAPQGIPNGPYNLHTIGARYHGVEESGLMYEAEGMMQLGDKRGESIIAQAATGGVGYNAKELCWSPQAWIYYDYASGDSNPATGTTRTFNQLYPFGHYYFGFIDVVGRQNIHDLNGQFAVYPKKWLSLATQYHIFNLDKASDALYNSGGVAIRRDPTGRAGTDVGQELDLFSNIHLDKHSDILVGYSHLFEGDFIRGTTPGSNLSPDYFYLQFSYRW